MINIAICFCQFEGKILLLKRAPHKPEGLRWTAPGGKCDPGEPPLEGAKRELMEETGIVVEEHEGLLDRGQFILHYKDYSIQIHLFLYCLKALPKIVLRKEEHIEFTWIKPFEALSLPIMEGAENCIKRVFPFLETELDL